jgi:TonB-linked SusC/RagA family outer membrane protein
MCHFINKELFRFLQPISIPLKKSIAFGLVLFLMVLSTQSFAQQGSKTVTGTVRDENGQVMQGVSVKIKSGSKNTTTDANGHYTISANSNAILVFAFVGFGSKEEALNNRTTIDIALKETNKNLGEVVVIGYGTVKRRDLTGAVSSVSGKDIAATPVANIAQAMQGKLTGVNITSQDGRPGAGINIRVRGGGSISQSNQALVLIDGIPGNLNDIPADQVESVDVLKDASSSAIYGSRGANGVVLVTTKSAKAGKTNVSYNFYNKINTPVAYLQALSPYNYLQYVWGNAASNGAAYQTPFELLYGLGANAGTNTGGIDAYKNLPIDDIQKQAYKQSVSSNHAISISSGTDKTKVLFSATYSDDQGMKIQSYQKRVTSQLKINQKNFRQNNL